MKTDKQLFAIFSARPEWVFELAGLESPGTCTMCSMTFKELELRCDSIIVPNDPSKPIAIAEFQIQLDRRIYNRAAIEMALAQNKYDGRAVEGFIFVASRKLDPQTQPWNQIIRCFAFDEMIESLAKNRPNHPLVAVFQPLVVDDESVLEASAKRHYHTIRTSDLDDETKKTLLDVFVNWIQQRLKTKGWKEIEMLFIDDLPELKDTKSGQELIQHGHDQGKLEGKVEGKREGKLEGKLEGTRMALCCQLEAKFGSVPELVQQRIDEIPTVEKLTHLLRQVLKVDSYDQFDWN